LITGRPAFHPDAGGAKWLVAALGMAGWATLIGLAHRRAHGLGVHPPLPGRRAITAYSFVTVAFALLGGLVVIL
jgi:hypothetical protein